ncbi:hypothetical protein OG379_39830 (plasmid) [Streptomyces sp. NBC_01166]|uniref:hypothetical protein n=1 Tax=Streptomyces sp. NBC_01166 TaxID=2903755 RepID=UPI002F90EA42|nr:hypothetical protein OG379_39830 [Streptomyces sp. NBC_01166]
MEPETLAAVFGLGGTLVGAGVSVWATIISQRHQARTAVTQRTEDRGRAAGEKALEELYNLRRFMTEFTAVMAREEGQPWRLTAKRHFDEAELAVMLMPNAREVQDRIEELMGIAGATLMVGREHAQATDGMELLREIRRCRHLAVEAIQILSAYMRDDTLPGPSRLVIERREAEAHSEGMYQGELPPV